MNKIANNSYGFSLMEVNIAVAMISVGLLAVFSLFPVGLRESSISVADNQEAMFANHVLSCLEGNAARIQDWAQWSDPIEFSRLIVSDVIPLSTRGLSVIAMGQGVPFPSTDDSGRLLRYNFSVLRWYKYNGVWRSGAAGGSSDSYMLQLEVKSGIYGDFYDQKTTYVSIVTYMGE